MRRMQEGAYPGGKGAPSFITQPGRALHRAACPELPPPPSSWPAHWPWDPQLLQDTHGHWKSQLDEKHICGAVLVRPRWVLTATHCEVAWNLSDFRVVLGAHNLNTPEPTQQVFNITRAVPYPLYNAQQDIHDIQLLKLHTSACRTSSVRPMPLPGRNRDLRPGSQCHVMGWGETTGHDDPSAALLEATVVVQPQDTCNTSWRGALTRDMLCASTGTRERRGQLGRPPLLPWPAAGRGVLLLHGVREPPLPGRLHPRVRLRVLDQGRAAALLTGRRGLPLNKGSPGGTAPPTVCPPGSPQLPSPCSAASHGSPAPWSISAPRLRP
nr:granzyme G-like isoform X2 [Equus caballus]